MAPALFKLSTFFLAYTWLGYYLLLRVFVKIFPDKRPAVKNERDYKPFVSVVISAYNEANVIEQRIKNLLLLNYPKDTMEILIGSDGSTDNTVGIAEKYSNQGVRPVAFHENRGRADVHNDLIEMAKGPILVFTDADTIFDVSFLDEIVKPFANTHVGAVVGNLSYKISDGIIAENEGVYWSYEQKIRELEDKLGILNNGTGACMAIRKDLFKPLAPVDDVDTATVIDIILQGFRAVYKRDAIAFDIPPHKAESEFKMRIRGTSKTLSSIRRRLTFWVWIKHPILTWSLVSHRLGRYFTPYLMIVAFVSNMFLLDRGFIYKALLAIQLGFYALVIAGWVGNRASKRISVASSCFSFCVAMSGMMVGVAKAFTGKVTVTYKTDDSH